MANNATDYLEDKLVRHALGITAFTMPATVKVHLHSSDPTETGAVGEIAGGTYAAATTTFSALAGGSASNAALIRWNDCGAVTLTHFTISDGTNKLFYGVLTTPVTLAAGQPFEIPLGNLVVTFL
jgi:hypothetical protein